MEGLANQTKCSVESYVEQVFQDMSIFLRICPLAPCVLYPFPASRPPFHPVILLPQQERFPHPPSCLTLSASMASW